MFFHKLEARTYGLFVPIAIRTAAEPMVLVFAMQLLFTVGTELLLC